MIRKHAIWVVLATLVGLAGAWLALSGQAVAYGSSAAVDVEPRIITGSVPVTPNLATEEKVATSGVVLDVAASILGVDTGHLSSLVTVSVSGTSNVLSIGCTMPGPVEAQNCAGVVTKVYMNFRNETDAKKSVQSRDPLQVTLVSPAILPISPAGTKKTVLLSIGAFLGFLIGLGAVYVRDRADDRVRDRADLSQNLSAPALAEIPRERRKVAPAAFAFARAPGARTAEAYRYLRVRIEALSAADAAAGQVVQVTGPRGGEGSTTVSSNLAAALAQIGHRVMLVDGNVRSAALSALYGAVGRPGLADLITGTSSLSEVTVATELPRLRMIPAGLAPNESADIFDQAALAVAVAQIAAVVDVIVIDSGPVLEVSDPIALASVSNVVIMVADARRTTRTAVRSAAHEISSPSGRHVVGVLNHTPRTLLRIFSAGLPSGRHGSNAGGPALAPQGQPDDKAVGAGRVTVEASDQ